MSKRLSVSSVRRIARLALLGKFLILLAVGRSMHLADAQPPAPPQVSAVACRGCEAERRVMARWNAASTADRWQCRARGRGWEDVEACLADVADSRTKAVTWRLD